MKQSRRLSLVLFLSFVCGSAPAWAQDPSLPHFGHVFIVVEENHGYSSVVGSSSMPYLNSLISQYGLATNYVADTHPSIGNYFMLTTGHILTNNDSETPSSFPVSADNIAHELELTGGTWKDYREMTGTYYVRHDPLAFMTNINSANRVDFTQFATDLANGNLPDLSWIVPNGCDDAHDCSLSTADSWLQTNIDPLVKSPLFQQDGLLIITFDENSGSGSCTDSDIQAGTWCGGQVATVLISPLLVSKGFKSSSSYHHESVLRLMSQGLGLTNFPGFSSGAGNMSDFFAAPPVVTLLPAALAFPNQAVGATSAPQVATLRNGTSSPLSISGIAITGTNSGDFAQTNNCGSSLAAGASCAIDATFTPAAPGNQGGSLTVSDDASNSPQTIVLNGVGMDFAIAPGAGSVTSATVSAGQSANYKLDIDPENGFNQTVSLSCSGAPPGATCTISPASVSLNGTSASAVTATVTTTARSALAPSAKWILPGLRPRGAPLGGAHWPPAAWFLAGLALLAWAGFSRKRRTRLALGLALLSLLLWGSCGGSGGGGMTTTGSSGTPTGTYNLTVRGSYTSGSDQLVHTMTLNLTVQ